MENASKALIIAGAILLSILLISLGIFVFTQAQDTMGAINLNEQEVMAFNNKFLPYEGKIRGTQLKQLLQTVRTVNATAAEEEGTTEEKVKIKGGAGISGTGSDNMKKIQAGKTYDVTLEYNEKTTMVESITIENAS